MYLLKLVDGTNPIDNSRLSEDDAANNERIKKCFLYIAQVLDSRIGSVGTCDTKSDKTTVSRKSRAKKSFYITSEQIANIKIRQEPCLISELVKSVNEAAECNDCKKLVAKTVNDWLVDEGYLKTTTNARGQCQRDITVKSSEIGISSRQGMGAFGPYPIVMYSEQAQKYIVAHMAAIIERVQESKEE